MTATLISLTSVWATTMTGTPLLLSFLRNEDLFEDGLVIFWGYNLIISCGIHVLIISYMVTAAMVNFEHESSLRIGPLQIQAIRQKIF